VSFYPGQHVICINDDWSGDGFDLSELAGIDLPKKGLVYTVEHTEPPLTGVQFIVYLEEFSLPEVTISTEDGEISGIPGFGADHFRPLDETRLDIFRAHLAPSPKQKERA